MELNLNENFNESPEMVHGMSFKIKKWKKAENYYTEMLQNLNENGDKLIQAAVLNQLGRAMQEQGYIEEAHRLFKESLELKENYGGPIDRASTLHNLAMLAQRQRSWKEARRLYNQALQLKIQYGNRKEQSSTLHQLGLLYHEQQMFSEAKLYYNDALKAKSECACRHEQAATLHQLGRLAEDQGDYEAAIDYAIQAIGIYAKYNDSSLFISLKLLARIYCEHAEYPILESLSEILDMDPSAIKFLLLTISNIESTRMN